jgi:Ca2+-binding RTX toxin-like protein
MTADGSGQTNLTNNPSADRRPDWQPIVPSTPGPPPPQRTLTVNLGGSGTGSVTGSGISCPASCAETYVNGSPVTLDAAGTGGSIFGGWGGSCGGTGNCQLTMDADKTVSADFLSPVITPPSGPSAVLATCKGLPATIAGTDGHDVESGTPGRDVIVGLAGNDTLSSLAGNDVICGGPGKDTLKGGKGKDTLLGQKGKDTLKGGGGADLCKGGKGKDTASKCEVEKSI